MVELREKKRGQFCGTMLDLPFPPCVALTVQTAAQRASQQDRQDRQMLIRERQGQEQAMTHEHRHTLFISQSTYCFYKFVL